MPYLSFMFLEETTVAFLCPKAPCALKFCGMLQIGLVSWLVELTLYGFDNSIVPIVRSVLKSLRSPTLAAKSGHRVFTGEEISSRSF
jgi:hypothetical protein